MFNTQKFNIGKFNVPSTNVASMSGAATVTTGASGSMSVKKRLSGTANATGRLEPASIIRKVQISAEPIEALTGALGKWYNRLLLHAAPVEAVTGASAKAIEVYGVETISLPDIVLKPGQELIIDTNEMTVTIDGENAIHLLSADSDFFALMQGENIITYSDNAEGRTAGLKVVWKDVWL